MNPETRLPEFDNPMRVLKPLVTALAIVIAFAASADETPPIGACIITVPTYTPACIPDIARDACDTRAGHNGGTAEWHEDQDCPDLPQAYIDKTGGGAAVIYNRPRVQPRPR